MSTVPKFTQGPWKYHGPYEHFNVKRWVIYFRASDYPSAGCEVFKANADERTCVANAHLIAAAPDLYEALDACLDVLHNVGESHTVLFDQVVQALAKARGDSVKGCEA